MTHAANKRNQNFLFNPYELAFCGFSRSGKTTLITRLIQSLSVTHKIGYIKHDVHGFDMDREGKDTFMASQSGANMVFIGDDRHNALLQHEKINMVAHQNLFLENDFVFVEGYKNSKLPKIIFIDKDQKILEDINAKRFDNVIAFCGLTSDYPKLPVDKPYFHREDVDGLKNFVLSYFDRKTEEIPLYGLVLTGGKSTRMKKDKSLLEYHGRSQTEYCYDLLEQICEKTFVSNRAEQSRVSVFTNFSQIHDTFLNMGPLGGILSAMSAYPNKAWLVLACDLPFVNQAVLQTLIQKRNSFKIATAYQSVNNDFPEPLCTIYEPKSVFRLFQFLAKGYSCPRKTLINSGVHLIQQDGKTSLENVNNPKEYEYACKTIKESQGNTLNEQFVE